jgi:hypothetical protein
VAPLDLQPQLCWRAAPLRRRKADDEYCLRGNDHLPDWAVCFETLPSRCEPDGASSPIRVDGVGSFVVDDAPGVHQPLLSSTILHENEPEKN